MEMIKRRKLNQFVRALCFMILLIVFFSIMQTFLHPKHHSQYTMDDFYRLPRNSVDVLFCGSSHMAFGMDSNIFSEMTGQNAYSIAINVQHLNYTLEYLEEALKTQSPNMVVIDSVHFIKDTQDMQIVDLHDSVDSLRWSGDKLKGIMEIVPREYWFELLFPIVRFHSRWTDLGWEDLRYCLKIGVQGKGNRGFKGLETITPVEVGGWSMASTRPLSDSAEVLLGKFIKLSEEYGFQLMFLNFPVTGLVEEDYERYNTLYKFCDEHGIEYVDYNKTHYKGFDQETDFADYGHLNVNGAKKLSRDFVEKYGEK